MLRKSLLLIVFICIGFLSYCTNSGTDTDEETAIPVEVQAVSTGDVVQSLFYQGDIKAELEVKVFSKIPDRIEKFYVDEGDYIKKGAPIAKILATTIEQALLQAEAQKINLETEYARTQKLRQENAISQQQLDALEAQVTQVRAAFTTARSQLNDAKVVAPISGIIGKRYYEVGDMAAPAFPLVSIVQMDQIKIEFNATEEDLGRLAVGQKAEIQVKSYNDKIFKGKIIRISPILDPITRMATVEVLIPNKDHHLKPGMFAEVKVIVGNIENTIIVPRYAVIENTSLKDNNGKDQVLKNYFVYVVDDSSRAEQRLLDVQYVNHIQIAVKSGIQVGDRLVVSGQNNLRDNMKVKISGGQEAE